MHANKKLKILLVGEGLERFNPQIEVLKDKCHFIIEDAGKCLTRSLSAKEKDLNLVILHKRSIKDNCVTCIKKIKGFFPQVIVIAFCEDISKETLCSLFRSGVRDVLMRPFENEISIIEAITKMNFLFVSRPKNRERRYNFLTLKHIKEFPNNQSDSMTDDKRIERAKEYIEKNYSNSLSLEQTAGVACISKFHFCRTFKRIKGISFKEYLNNVRIGKAKELLNSSELSIAEIAFEVGFRSLPHFTTLFKSHMNISPGRFRKITPAEKQFSVNIAQ